MSMNDTICLFIIMNKLEPLAWLVIDKPVASKLHNIATQGTASLDLPAMSTT